MPLQVEITPTRTYALVSDPAPNGKILIWSATATEVGYYLISSDSPSCFALYKDGRYVIAGTDSGALCLWDLQRQEKTKQIEGQLILQPICTTDQQGMKNHRNEIVSISVFGRTGSPVVSVLDCGACVSFWYLRNESTSDVSLVKAETVRLAQSFMPSYAMKMIPNSLNGFLAGVGQRLFNCCRFQSPTFPDVFRFSGTVKSIAFSPVLPHVFAVGGDNGRIGIWDISESEPILEVTLNFGIGDCHVAWSPKRASVLVIGDSAGMKVYVYDLLASTRSAQITHKVSSKIQGVSVTETSTNSVIAVADSGNCITVYRLTDDFAKPLSDVEMSKYKQMLFALTK
jgi:WD40 repeat protein